MTEAEGTKSPRERYRAQVRAEIKEHAWEQIATAGASALSLNAIAKRMGMSGPALYRYFGSRDELITELIRDAYRSLADTFRATASRHGADVRALAHALRAWALADPQRYLLLYGTPVPGYHAPADITAISAETMATILDAWAAQPPDAPEAQDAPETPEAQEAQETPEAPDAQETREALEATDTRGAPFAAHLASHRDWAGDHPAPPAALHRALTFWTRLHGVLSLELAGHFTGMGFDPARLFAAELDALTGRPEAG
ncbi:TetR/AcrR family transcriptional regulator [Streptomyces sp. NPDC006624]|uniref:TetR/AcrR family transcriptional regulator n=1 Tax=Streptomyces sp. NPDC006624 TaxID=3154892 RepID=UPI0033AE0B66